MELFWKRFLLRGMRRVGVALFIGEIPVGWVLAWISIGIGLVLYSIVLSQWYTKAIFTLVLLLASTLWLIPPSRRRSTRRRSQIEQQQEQQRTRSIQDGCRLGGLFLFLLPKVLEIQTLLCLSHIILLLSPSTSTSMSRGSEREESKQWLLLLAPSFVFLFVVGRRLRHRRRASLHSSWVVNLWKHAQEQHCCNFSKVSLLLGYYLLAWISVVWFVAQVPRYQWAFVSAPLLVATGTTILQYYQHYHHYHPNNNNNNDNNNDNNDSDWLSRILRQTLRMTLKDVVQSIRDDVWTQSDWLQLIMIRWIIDYWNGGGGGSHKDTTNNTSTTTTTTTNTNTTTSTTTPTNTTGETMDKTISKKEKDDKDNHKPDNATGTKDPTSTILVARRHGRGERRTPLTWQELFPMLTVTTNRVRIELEQQPSLHRPTQTLSSSSSSSFQDFQTMLRSMNVDEQARPAVMAYKQAIQHDLPPPKGVAWLVAGVRTCPTWTAVAWRFGTVAWWSSWGSTGHWQTVGSTIVLFLPLLVLEAMEAWEWVQTCHQQTVGTARTTTNDGGGGGDEATTTTIGLRPVAMTRQVWRHTDAMKVLLLSGQQEIGKPTTRSLPLVYTVWQNTILGSLSALEFGLTAATCVQTTSVAVEFCGNLGDLFELKRELFDGSSRGYDSYFFLWGKLAAILAQEWWWIQQQEQGLETANSNETTTLFANRYRRRPKYTTAAMNAVSNAQIITRNIKSLAEDDNLLPIHRSVVSKIQGWFGGLGNSRENSTAQDTTLPPISITNDDEKVESDQPVADNAEAPAHSILEEDNHEYPEKDKFVGPISGDKKNAYGDDTDVDGENEDDWRPLKEEQTSPDDFTDISQLREDEGKTSSHPEEALSSSKLTEVKHEMQEGGNTNNPLAAFGVAALGAAAVVGGILLSTRRRKEEDGNENRPTAANATGSHHRASLQAVQIPGRHGEWVALQE